MATIFDLRHTQMSDIILICFIALLDPKNMVIAVRFSLLSCIRIEVYVISYLLQVNDRRLRFITCLDIGKYTCLTVLPGPENMGVVVRISLLSCIRVEVHVVSYLLPVNDTIFDKRRIQTSDSIPTSLTVLPDSEKHGSNVGISLLYHVYKLRYVDHQFFQPPSWISDFQLHHDSTIEQFDPENMRVALGIILASLEAEIHLEVWPPSSTQTSVK